MEGLYVVRLKMPAGYKIPAHNHPTTEYVTVVSGAFNIGMEDELDEQQGIALRPGGFAEAAARQPWSVVNRERDDRFKCPGCHRAVALAHARADFQTLMPAS